MLVNARAGFVLNVFCSSIAVVSLYRHWVRQAAEAVPYIKYLLSPCSAMHGSHHGMK